MQIIILIASQMNDTFRFHLKLDLSIMRAEKLRSALAEAIEKIVKTCSSTDTFGLTTRRVDPFRSQDVAQRYQP
ncbi:hypothetical protein T12_1140 [Trichinella patagoniensis]|uniref:Uncharacterized protein n=1 Tax=Trichinella patagoniensis TaxID=990121 RepID=A0A0V1ACP8_9BILA|nr:hypothetical protein T12_1140 [Trichinella patagoniensis]